MLLTLTLVCASMAQTGNQGIAVLQEAPWPYSFGHAEMFVVRDAKELVEASPERIKSKLPEIEQRVMTEVAKALKVKSIDWKAQMLVVIQLKQVNPQGIIVGPIVDLKKGELIVNYAYWRPVEAREGDVPPEPTDIATMVLVKRFDGKVRFKGSERTPK